MWNMQTLKHRERGQVFVFDAEPERASVFANALRRWVSVETCSDAATALELVRGTHYLAVIVDHSDHAHGEAAQIGIELLERVARLSPETVKILVAADVTAELLTRGINAGIVDHFFPKPVDLEAVVQIVSRTVRRSMPPPSSRWHGLVVGSNELFRVARDVLTQFPMRVEHATDLDRMRSRATGPHTPCDLVLWEAEESTSDMLTGICDVRRSLPAAAIVCFEKNENTARAGQLLALGADEVIFYPLRGDEVDVRVRRALERRRLIAEAQRARRSASQQGLRELLGCSAAMRELFQTIEQVAPTDSSLLIRGETGTGKELVARVVHALSPRRSKPFVAVNCAAMPQGLVESELFGHERGAFTGATGRRLGRFESAHGGTLFIDEVGDLPMPVQIKVLRVIQERSFERVGGNEIIQSDIRLIAATHRNLEELIEQGEFRRDLFYRLNVIPVFVPALRERIEDIWPLAEHYLKIYEERMHKEGITFSPRMRDAMEAYDWPGNVRELINVVERAVALAPSWGVADRVSFAPQDERPSQKQRAAAKVSDHRTLKERTEEFESSLLREALERAGGNKTRAAKELGLTRQGLSLKLAKYGLA
jgi:DNA-binding NtrC family response regulator